MMSFPLSLRVWSEKEDTTAPLGSLVTRINEERGHFRNITEDSLREEIEHGDTLQDAVESDVDDVYDPEQRRKTLYAARTEMLKFIR